MGVGVGEAMFWTFASASLVVLFVGQIRRTLDQDESPLFGTVKRKHFGMLWWPLLVSSGLALVGYVIELSQ